MFAVPLLFLSTQTTQRTELNYIMEEVEEGVEGDQTEDVENQQVFLKLSNLRRSRKGPTRYFYECGLILCNTSEYIVRPSREKIITPVISSWLHFRVTCRIVCAVDYAHLRHSIPEGLSGSKDGSNLPNCGRSHETDHHPALSNSENVPHKSYNSPNRKPNVPDSHRYRYDDLVHPGQCLGV